MDFMKDRSLEELQAHLEILLRDLDDAIIIQTAEGIVTTWNLGAENLFGYTREEVIGRRVELFDQPSVPNSVRLGCQRVGPIEKHETVGTAKDGTRVLVGLTLCALPDECGQPSGVLYMARPRTGRFV